MKMSKQSGFSLIEVLVTVAIAAIIVAVATPSVKSFVKNNQIRTTVDLFVSSLYQARSEAVKRNFSVAICASDPDQLGCDPLAVNFANGWIVFTDYDENRVFDATTAADTTGDGVEDSVEEILFASKAPEGKLIVTGNNLTAKTSLGFSPDGTSGGRPSYTVSTDGQAENQVATIKLSQTGRVRSCIGDQTKCN